MVFSSFISYRQTYFSLFVFPWTTWPACFYRLFSLAWAFSFNMVPPGPRCVSSRSDRLNKTNKETNKETVLQQWTHYVILWRIAYKASWIHLTWTSFICRRMATTSFSCLHQLGFRRIWSSWSHRICRSRQAIIVEYWELVSQTFSRFVFRRLAT